MCVSPVCVAARRGAAAVWGKLGLRGERIQMGASLTLICPLICFLMQRPAVSYTQGSVRSHPVTAVPYERAHGPRRPGPHQDGGAALTKMAPRPHQDGGGRGVAAVTGSGRQAVPSRPSMAEAPGEGPRLPELLERGWRLLEEVEASTEPSSGAPSVQAKVRQGLGALQRAAAMVEELQLFSENEELEEIASADLKYLLVPALLGALTLRQVEPSRRREHLESGRRHLCRFLELCRSYGLSGAPPPPAAPREDSEPGSAAPSSLLGMASSRQAKIERYKQKKELENKLASLRTFVESGQADEEQVRELYLLQVKKWVNISFEEIESIDQEMVILKSRDTMKQSSAPPHGPSRQVRTPLKPFILTRDAVQAKVFGAGYPGLPTMTVNDWYDQKRREEAARGQSAPQRPPNTNDEELQKEQQEKIKEEDDEEALQKARDWDDWKDTHPRGYGNRQNMG
ncbi:immunoglobulin-binding protein 1 isoform X2 [Phasianus colchicus]|uniref:immunoglobulin-binding protein 1 isoform X2 n=1 Tax=Phasianus colchicus TaxID=9054 RepID=UPI00129D3463|nr:immunoglobulin-binding protein 1 isoform X2 [Phasianus colchicus]